MSGWIILKGKSEVGAISAFDRSFALGDGLFETVKIAAGVAVWLDEHLKRLFDSARFAGIECAYDEGEVAAAVLGFIRNEKISEGFLRITLSRGETAGGRFSEMPRTGTLVITGREAETGSAPLKAGWADWRVNETDPAVRHKSTSRFSSVLAWRSALTRSLGELIFLNSDGMVTEGIISNVFWFKDGVLQTPSDDCGLLPGVARGKILRVAESAGVRTETGRYPTEAVLGADGLFFTNSLWIIRVCDEFEGKRFVKAGDEIRHLRNLILKSF